MENPALRPAGHLGECTMFLVPGELSGEDGLPITGQTWDMHADAIDHVLLVRRRPDDAPATLGLTTAGCLCLIASNSEGVAVGNTNLVAIDARPGVNYLFTITRALRARSAAGAADAIEATDRLGGHNFYAADAREAFNVETTATRAVRTPVGAAVFTHTNHYLAKELGRLEFAGRVMENTRWRQETITCELAQITPPVRAADGWAKLAGVAQGPGGPCDRAGVSAGPDAATVATVLQCPGAGRMWICAGPPTADNRCEVRF
jgi:hypothetical protein